MAGPSHSARTRRGATAVAACVRATVATGLRARRRRRGCATAAAGLWVRRSASARRVGGGVRAPRRMAAAAAGLRSGLGDERSGVAVFATDTGFGKGCGRLWAHLSAQVFCRAGRPSADRGLERTDCHIIVY